MTTPELIFIPTGQKILFRGADKPRKLKSTKVAKGYIRYIWYEELDEFSGQDEIDTINQSLMRGGEVFSCFYSFNPPREKNPWVNSMCDEPRKDRLIHKSDYRAVPADWLGPQFIAEAEYLRERNPARYENEYLGIASGTGAEIFPNVTVREITDEEINGGERYCRGLDWGYGADPFVYVAMIYDKGARRLLIYHEFYRYGAKYDEIAQAIKEENLRNSTVIAESGITEKDILFVVSNSGRNSAVIDAALEGKARGAVTVAITSVSSWSWVLVRVCTLSRGLHRENI